MCAHRPHGVYGPGLNWNWNHINIGNGNVFVSTEPRDWCKMAGNELPKVRDVEKESLYGYVYGVSGPGEWTACYNFSFLFIPYPCRLHLPILFSVHTLDKCSGFVPDTKQGTSSISISL